MIALSEQEIDFIEKIFLQIWGPIKLNWTVNQHFMITYKIIEEFKDLLHKNKVIQAKDLFAICVILDFCIKDLEYEFFTVTWMSYQEGIKVFLSLKQYILADER